MIVPSLLCTDSLNHATNLVASYYASRFTDFADRSDDPSFFRGAFYDNCSPSADDANCFTPGDLLSLPMLSIGLGQYRTVPKVLYYRTEAINLLLAQVRPDINLGDVPGPIPDDWPAHQLCRELRMIPGVGQVTATKLIARKRPMLYPIFDHVVKQQLSPHTPLFETIHEELSANPELRERLRAIRTSAQLPETISELRILDVVSWMYGQHPEYADQQAPRGVRSFMRY